MTRLQAITAALLLAALAAPAVAGQPYYVSARTAGEVWRLEDTNGDGDALDVGEKVLWADGFVRVVELEAGGRAVYAVEEGLADDTNQIVRLQDLNGDGDALDVGERLPWADGLDDPRSISRGPRGNWYVTEIDDSRVWRLRDNNGDGDAVDAGERLFYADGIGAATTVLARVGDVLVTAFTGNRVHRLVDANGDGDALDVGENIVVTPAIDQSLGLLPDLDGGFFFASRSGDTVYHARDNNGDGDMLDVAETLSYADSVFGGINGAWDMAPYPGGGFLLADYLDGQVLLVRDLTADGDALDPGEVRVWADGVDLAVDLVGAAGPGALDSMVTIQHAAGTLDGLGPEFVPIVNGSTLGRAAVAAVLDGGADALVSTDNPYRLTRGSMQQNAAAPITKTAGGAATLTIRADDDIRLAGGVQSSTGPLDVVLVANDAAQLQHDLDPAAGDVIVAAAIDTNAGDFTSSGADFDNTGGDVTAATLTIRHTGTAVVGAALTAAVLDLRATGGVSILTTGAVAGSGSIDGSATNAGSLAPGSSTGIISLSGAYTQLASGTLRIDVGGLNPGADYDQLIASGSANLDGRLVVTLIGGWDPGFGAAFTVLEAGPVVGAFAMLDDTAAALALSSKGYQLEWLTDYDHPGQVELLVGVRGDLDFDGDVDFDDIDDLVLGLNNAAAYLAAYGHGSSAAGDLDADGDSDFDDIDQFVDRLIGGAPWVGRAAVREVPEPPAVVAAIVALLLMLVVAFRRRAGVPIRRQSM